MTNPTPQAPGHNWREVEKDHALDDALYALQALQGCLKFRPYLPCEL